MAIRTNNIDVTYDKGILKMTADLNKLDAIVPDALSASGKSVTVGTVSGKLSNGYGVTLSIYRPATDEEKASLEKKAPVARKSGVTDEIIRNDKGFHVRPKVVNA